MADNHTGLESGLNTINLACDDPWPRLAKREKMPSPELKVPGVEEFGSGPRKKLILFVEIDGRTTEGVAVIARCRSGKRSGRARGRWRMTAVFLDPETGRAAPLAVKERPDGKVEGPQPQRGRHEPSLGLSVTFPDELPFTIDETALPLSSPRGQRSPLPAERREAYEERVPSERGERRGGGRAGGSFGGIFSFKDLFIDFDKYEVTIAGKKVSFPPIETRLLFFFVRHPGRVYTREQLLDHVWNSNVYISPRNVDVHISHIRKSIEKDPARPVYVVSIQGVGYKFDHPGV